MTPDVAEWRVDVGSDATSAIVDPATTSQRAMLVCAHGAGGNKNDRGLARSVRALRDAGLAVVRFNFLYSERKSRRPDPMPKLMECVTAVARRTREEFPGATVLIGGRSMGGRAASMLAAEGFNAGGLLLLAYPLHPPGKPDQPRDAHLPQIRMPVLCVNGTRDAFCRRDLMEKTLTSIRTPWTMHWIDGADHGFRAPRSLRSEADVDAELSRAARHWLTELGL